MKILLIAALAASTISVVHHPSKKHSGTQDIDSLHLSPKAKKAAQQLLREYPHIVFTSGRRDLAQQARAMAGNIVLKRDYIKKTYASNEASRACQQWVDDHPEAKTQKEIAAGLLATFKKLGTKAGQISKHLTGDAFDVQPVKENADATKKSIRALPGVKKFLEKEAGLERWHVQF